MTENKNALTRQLYVVEPVPQRWADTGKTPLQHHRSLQIRAGIRSVDVDPAPPPQRTHGQAGLQLSEEAARD